MLELRFIRDDGMDTEALCEGCGHLITNGDVRSLIRMDAESGLLLQWCARCSP